VDASSATRIGITPVTDPAEIAELEKLDGDLGRPIPFKPNGHLWVDSEELKQWRALRQGD
jgi:hypothetical protein